MNAIDTNILVYSVDFTEPKKQVIAEQLLTGLSEQGETVLVWQALGEFARWLTSHQRSNQLTQDDVFDYLSSIRSSFPLAMPTPAVLDRALDLASRYSLSHWDSMLLGACLEAGVTTLYTEDMGAPRQSESAKTIDTIELVNPF